MRMLENDEHGDDTYVGTQFEALIAGAIFGALAKVSAPGGPFLIDVEPPLYINGRTVIPVRGRESGEIVRVLVEAEK